MNTVSTKKAPGAIGPYSQGIIANNFVYVSGQLPIDPATGLQVKDDIKAMTRQSLTNAGEILKEAGTDLSKVVKTTIYLTDLSLFSQVNEAYAEFFKTNPPARSCVEVSALPAGGIIEIEVIATL